MFRFKSSINADYNRQGYIYFYSKLFRYLSKKDQEEIRSICSLAGKEYAAAVFDAVTTDRSVCEICMNHNLSESTLLRSVRRYYEILARNIG